MNIPDHFFKSLETISDPDPGSGIFLTLNPHGKNWIRDNHKHGGEGWVSWQSMASTCLPFSGFATINVFSRALQHSFPIYFIIFFAKSILFSKIPSYFSL
jgi:hypothetical protein